jgi:hypothetical protein
METKYQQAKNFYDSGDLKNSLKILKKFKYAFSKEELSIITRAYEILTKNSQFYIELGFNVDTEIEKAKVIVNDYFN